MARHRQTEEAEAIGIWSPRVREAKAAFDCRWSMASLRRIDQELHRLMCEQANLFDKATVMGTAREVSDHAQATIRGWAAAVRAMETAGEADDAYLIGADPQSGLMVAIGAKATAERVVQVQGSSVIHVTPDEVAVLLGATRGFSLIAEIKRRWPGADVTGFYDRYPGEPRGDQLPEPDDGEAA